MNRIAYSFLVTPLILGATAASFSILITPNEVFPAALIAFIMFSSASYVGLLIGLPFIMLLKKYNKISLFSILVVGLFCATFINSIPTYFLYLVELHRGEAGTFLSYILTVMRISFIAGPLAGLIFWNFAFRSPSVSINKKH